MAVELSPLLERFDRALAAPHLPWPPTRHAAAVLGSVAAAAATVGGTPLAALRHVLFIGGGGVGAVAPVLPALRLLSGKVLFHMETLAREASVGGGPGTSGCGEEDDDDASACLVALCAVLNALFEVPSGEGAGPFVGAAAAQASGMVLEILQVRL